MSQNPDSFKQNYETLQKIAQTLSQSDEIDIDELVPMVDEATRAYNLCKSRIEAVEAALNQRLETETKEETEEEPF